MSRALDKSCVVAVGAQHYRTEGCFSCARLYWRLQTRGTAGQYPFMAPLVVELPGIDLGGHRIGGRSFTTKRPAAAIITHPIRMAYGSKASLTHRCITDLRLDRDGCPLVEGRDYRSALADGSLVALADVPPFIATASFRAQQSRYDAIWFDPTSNEVGLVHGPERGTDVVDHMPVIAAPKMRLASLHVTADDVVLIETWRAPDVRWTKNCRARLPRFMGLLADGAPVRLLGYGTSITTIGGPMPTHYFAPNGPHRDILDGYFTNGGGSRLAPDTVAAIPVFDHGAGPHHVHVGINWTLVAAITPWSPVTYLNMAISGTEAGAGERPDGRPNGGNARRLAAATELKPDVVVLEYLINDLDRPDLANDLVLLIETFQRAGAEVIVLGCPGFTNYRSDRHWQFGEDAAAAAADRTGAAFVPLAPIVEGATGMARRTLGSASGLHHPGPTELMTYGRWLANIVPSG